MSNHSKKLGKVVNIDDAKITDHLGELVRGTVEETLNAMLDAETDTLCGAQRYKRSPDRVDTRAGSYERQFHTKAGEVTLKLSFLTFEATAGGFCDPIPVPRSGGDPLHDSCADTIPDNRFVGADVCVQAPGFTKSK